MTASRIGRALGVIALGLVLMAGCAAAPNPNGDDGGNLPGNDGGGGGNPPGDAEPIQDIGGFFDADRAWAVTHESVFVGGFGKHVEFVSISLGPDQPICLGMDPEASVSFDGRKFQILTTFAGVEFGDSCRLQITADAAACALNSLGFAPSPCDLTDAVGDITIDGASVRLDVPQVIRFGRCDPVLLSSRNQWGITNAHPFALIPLNDPGSIGAVFALGGERDDIVGVSLLTGLDGEMVTGCEDEEISNDVLSYDLEHLAIDVTMDAGEACTATFAGDVVYCALINPADLGAPIGQSNAIVRVEGSGNFTHARGGGDFEVMYLTYPSGPSGGGGCNGVRCKAAEAPDSLRSDHE
jgi:hypothetical protein